MLIMLYYTLILAILISPVAISNTDKELSIQEQAKANYAQEQKSQWVQKGLSVVPFIIGSALSRVLIKSENRILSLVGGILGGLFSDMMIAQTLSKPMLGAVNSGAKQAASWITGSAVEEDKHPTDALFIEIETLGLEFEQNKDKLSASAQALFKKLQKSALTAKSQGRVVASMTGDDQVNADIIKKQFTPIISVMRVLLDLPQKTQAVHLDANLKTKLKPILDRYSDKLQEDIKTFTIAISRSSKLSNGSKSVLYLLGEPGTGKTTFTESFSGAIGLPLIKIMDIEKALSVKAPLFQFADIINEDFKLSLFSEMLRNQPKNAVLFLDELDKIFNKLKNPMNMGMGMGTFGVNLESFLHQLLDPNKNTIKLPDLDIEIDVSGWILIAAGNKRLDSSSIRSRMTELIFPCIEKEKRPLIAQNRFKTRMLDYPDLQQNQRDLEMIQTIVQEDPFCGVRSLEFVVDDYIHWKDLQQANWGMDSDFDVEAAFKKHPSNLVNSTSVD